MSRFEKALNEHGEKVVRLLVADHTSRTAIRNLLDQVTDDAAKAFLRDIIVDFDQIRQAINPFVQIPGQQGQGVGGGAAALAAYKADLFQVFALMVDPSAERRNGAYKYLDWAARAYIGRAEQRKHLKGEDLYKMKDDLKDFESFKGNFEAAQRSIEAHENYDALLDLLRPHQQRRDEKRAEREKRRMDPETLARIMKNTTVIYDGDEGKVVVPHDAESSIYWGQGTRWCTAATQSGNLFDHYNSKTPLWLFLPKPTDEEKKIHSSYSSFKYTGTGGNFFDEHDRSNHKYLPPYLDRLIKAALKEATPRRRRFLEKYGSYKMHWRLEPAKMNSFRGRYSLGQAIAGGTDILKYATDDLRGSSSFMLFAAKKNIKALDYASEELKADKGFMMKLAARNSAVISYASDELKDDRDFVRTAMEVNRSTPKWYSLLMRPLKTLLIDDQRTPGVAFELASERLQQDKSLYILAMRNGLKVEKIPDCFAEDKDVARAAIRYGKPLAALSDKFKHDPVFVKWAIKKNTAAFNHAHAFRDHKDIVLMALRRNGLLLQHLPEDLKNDRKFVLTALFQNGAALEHVKEKFSDDREIVKVAVRSNGEALQHASDKLREDWGIVVNALSSTRKARLYAPLELRLDNNTAYTGGLMRAWRRAGAPFRFAASPVIMACRDTWGAESVQNQSTPQI